MDFIQILLHISIGFIMAFLGLLSPGLLTMTTLNTVIERGKKETVKFVTGVIIPIFFQAHIALLGADYLKKHPEIIQSFSKIAIYVFLVLSFIFYWQYKNRNKQAEINNYQIQNSLLFGVFISTINPLAIPFYFTYSTLLQMQGILLLTQPFVSIFVIGAVLGAFSILMIYANQAEKLLSKFTFFAKKFKLLLAIVMLILAILSFINAM